MENPDAQKRELKCEGDIWMRDAKKQSEPLKDKALPKNREGWKRLKECVMNNWVFAVGVVLCILIIFFHAKSAGHYANFYPINGSFQNYNPVRRLISGQIPYRDFQDYLGLGHLYIGSIVTLLFGGTFRHSLMAFSFLTLGGFAAISFVVAKAIFRKKELAIALTNISIVLIVIQPLFFSNGLAMTDEIKSALDAALGAGNSARFVRGLILPISFALIWAVNKYVSERFSDKTKYVFPILTGVVAGFSFIWSNDFGISCWLCIFIMTFWGKFTVDRKFFTSLQAAGIEFVSSIGAIFLFVEIFTIGHFGEWVQSTFGTGGYQRWYFNSGKAYYLWDADFSFLVIIQAGLCIYYLAKLLFLQDKRDSAREKYTCLAYVNMVSVCAVQEYKILSGGDNREIAFSILFVTVFYELLSLIVNAIGMMEGNKLVTVVSMIAGAAVMISSAHDEFIFDFVTDKGGVYVAELGGNIGVREDDLLDTAEFLGEDKFFSTYASGQEVVSGQFQPSGTDYIIHVLGDSQRNKYLKSFHNDDFKYVATIKEGFTDWEYWVQRSNWFLYREIFKEWHPVFANTYEVYWERNDAADHHNLENGFEINVSPIDDSTVIISVQSEAAVNGIADVFIDYEVKSRGNKSSYFNIQKVLNIENTGTVYAEKGSYYESNYLRDKSAEYIPVPITGGYGEVTLRANPKKSAYLELIKCSLNTVYTVTFDYLEVSDVKDGNILCIDISEKVKNAVKDISAVIYGGNEYLVEDITQDEDSLFIRVAGTIDVSESNIVELVR